ncbi:hypothetical protein RRX38_18625 [Pseudomonas sp. DTU_2021_1001937_2_SI_NGA_ILE_001]|uniref:hypothetical protein n=1 Tax=Pseudomonas sp. DTU_2021_1001937_2_SI_NGA_ILE_001 TaxID=3077589 RepID=UPI0025F2F726|nr:hypothetical protein [Pseudomonas sp. DTU_2021_1001937_2_SI_NGA_ILE_001]WNW13085.1 hypothetical protein RRX38_18625 [Pseudomonas sp. DTU_2021_1001937_2_SI_NGA_ILE_001]
MIGIHSVTLQLRSQATATSAISTAGNQTGAGNRVSSTATSSLTALGRQLAEAAQRADARYASMDRQSLGAWASSRLAQIGGASWEINKANYANEKPESDDPERLALARQASEAVSGNAGASNPFQSLPDDQLTLIIYDDSGAFTVNERRAALKVDSEREYAWRRIAVAKAMNEYNSTGKLTKFFGEVLDHYKGLPAVEQAQYPADYAPRLQHWIDLDFNYKTHRAEGHAGASTALVEQLLAAGATSTSGSPDELEALWKNLSEQL